MFNFACSFVSFLMCQCQPFDCTGLAKYFVGLCHLVRVKYSWSYIIPLPPSP